MDGEIVGHGLVDSLGEAKKLLMFVGVVCIPVKTVPEAMSRAGDNRIHLSVNRRRRLVVMLARYTLLLRLLVDSPQRYAAQVNAILQDTFGCLSQTVTDNPDQNTEVLDNANRPERWIRHCR